MNGAPTLRPLTDTLGLAETWSPFLSVVGDLRDLHLNEPRGVDLN
jgi:hypothetical protein